MTSDMRFAISAVRPGNRPCTPDFLSEAIERQRVHRPYPPTVILSRWKQPVSSWRAGLCLQSELRVAC